MQSSSILLLRRAATATASSRTSTIRQYSNTVSKHGIKSLALSVHFHQPDLGMKDYEILSRATAFLLGVDAPDPAAQVKEGPYGHLQAAEHKRKERAYRSEHGEYSPAGGPEGRKLMELGWLEFVPKEVRPQVHVVCSSHVVSPFLWKDYYPHDWLTQVRQEHVVYSLEVFDSDKPEEAVAKFALNPEPFHHPEGRDIALVHFKEEHSSLKLLKSLGVEILHLRDPDNLYSKGEDITFDGFVVKEANAADNTDFDQEQEEEVNEDTRSFFPYVEKGTLSFHTEDRFFATTPKPLPEGLCGAPALDKDGACCGTVEGIVPVDHPNPKLAGSAAFIPSFVMKWFVDYVERGLLEQMMPKDLFQMVVTAKQTNSIGGGLFKADPKTGKYTEETNWEEAYDIAIESLKRRYKPEEVNAILKTVERERKEVLEIMDKEGGDMQEIIERVRHKTMQIREMVKDQYQKQKEQEGQGESQAEKKAST